MKTIDLSLEETFLSARNYVVGEILNNVRLQYPKDKSMLSGVADLIIELENVSLSESIEFVADIKGFMLWAGMTNQKRGLVVTTLIHDLGEFARNRKANWFCPRTHGYRKYLSSTDELLEAIA